MTTHILTSEEPIDIAKRGFKPFADQFQPWINSEREKPEMLKRLAVHRHVRNRGGLGGKPLTVYVYSFTTDKPLTRVPETIHFTRYKLHPE